MPDYIPDAPERPRAPKHLSDTARGIFDDLVADLVDAGVPTKRADGHAIGMAAICLDEVRRWSEIGEQSHGDMRLQCAQVVARNQRDAQLWLGVIGATPKSRAQMGLRGKQEPKKLGAVASILQLKKQASGI
jgi:hypothetical protein